jgi:uncharacterized protein (DUF1697 family)
MTRQIALLRGINLGPKNRIAMPALREALEQAGMQNVRTYVQSGNVVLDSDARPDQLADTVRGLISERFGLDIAVLTRTRDEVAEVVARNPLGDVADNPKRYQVCFLERELDPPALEKLTAAASPSEQLVAIGRELYAWHPDGVARSKLWGRIAGPSLGVAATARNWTTVTTLLEMAQG